MSAIIVCPYNILELSTTTLTTGTAEAAYPLYRIYDRHPTRLFKLTSAVTATIKSDYGATAPAVNRVIFSAGHNIAGLTTAVAWSENATDYTVVSSAAAPSGAFTVTWGSVAKRYWRIEVWNPATAIQIPEIFLTLDYTWARNPSRPTGDLEDVPNVIVEQTASGGDRFLTMGLTKRQRNYSLPIIGEAQKAQLAVLSEAYAWAGAKPFWLCDHNGTWIFGKLTSPIRLREIGYQQYAAQFNFLEVIG